MLFRLLICIIPIYVTSFKINVFEPTIGKWDLLYSTNNKINFDSCNLLISPTENKLDELTVKIKRYEKNNLITYIKTINCKVINNMYNKNKSRSDDEICTLVILKTEKLIQSIGVFEFPYFAIDYVSGFNPEYIISWKVDKILGRLYIYFDENTYAFEKIYSEKIKNEESISTNFFLITNLLSFLLGKLLEKTIHIN